MSRFMTLVKSLANAEDMAVQIAQLMDQRGEAIGVDQAAMEGIQKMSKQARSASTKAGNRSSGGAGREAVPKHSSVAAAPATMPVSAGSTADGDQVQPRWILPVSAARKGHADEPPFPVLYVRPVEAAAMMRISRSKFYELMARGQIASCVIAGLKRIPIAAIEKFALETMKDPG
jgi:hypothetical protein